MQPGSLFVGDFSKWKQLKKYALKPKANGVWELKLKPDAMSHGDYYKMIVSWDGGSGERIPHMPPGSAGRDNPSVLSAGLGS